MANLGMTFKASELPVGTGGDFTPLPAGWYTATITSAEVRTTKAGTGSYIAVRYDITGPTHEGRVVFGNLNISNPNPKAEEIAHKQLGELMRAIGLEEVEDADQFIGGHCSIKLSVTKSDEYGDGNDVKAWRAVEGSRMPSPSAPIQKPEGVATAIAGATPPWAKK